jgi:hypothetical protein
MYYETSVSLSKEGLLEITNLADCVRPFKEHDSIW